MMNNERDLDFDGLEGEEIMLFRDWWSSVRQGYPEIPVPVLAAGLGRIFCDKMRIERDDKPHAPGSTIFSFAEPCWESLDYIIGWLRRSVQDNAAWLQDVDDRGRPNRLLSASRYIDLEREADRDADVRCSELATMLDKHDEITVEDLDDGFHIVRLLTREAVDLEARRMRHNVGQGADRDRFDSGEEAYYSLRRPDGFPVVTMGVELPANAPGVLLHIAGHRYSFVSDEHLAILIPWLRKQGGDGVDSHCRLMNEPELVYLDWKGVGGA